MNAMIPPSTPAGRAKARRGFRFVRPLQLLALLTLISCGGGGGSPGSGSPAGAGAPAGGAPVGTGSGPDSGTGTTTGTPSGGAAPGGRLVFKPVLSTTRSGGATTYGIRLYVFDPQAPAAPVSVTELGSDPMALYGIFGTRATSGNKSSHEYKDYGDAMVFFVNGGRLWKIDLSAGVSHDAVAVSSLTDVCGIGYPTQVSADGLDAWVPVLRGASACGPASGSATYVRSAMSATDAPVELPAPAIITTALDDGELNAMGLLLDFGGKLAMYDRNMAKVADVAGAAAPLIGGIEPLAYDYRNLQAYYFQVGSFLQRLTWTAAGAKFEAPIHAFASGTTVSYGASDPSAYYFADGNKVMKVEGGGTPALVATAPGDPVGRISMSADNVVLWQGSAFAAVRKADGAVTPLASNANFAGLTGQSLVYSVAGQAGTLRAVNLDGTQDRALGGQVGAHGITARVARIADQYYLDSVLNCVAAQSSDTGCSNGELRQTDIDSGATSVLGTIAHSATYPRASQSFGNGDAQYPPVTGSPALMGFSAGGLSGSLASTADLYLYTPGTPGSLVQLTHDIP